jgi:hypothetical protein
MTPNELKTDVEQAPKRSCLLYQQRINGKFQTYTQKSLLGGVMTHSLLNLRRGVTFSNLHYQTRNANTGVLISP